MADYLIQDTTLDAIADAINAKTGGAGALTPAQMVTEIGNIPSGGATITDGVVYTDFNSDGTVKEADFHGAVVKKGSLGYFGYYGTSPALVHFVDKPTYLEESALNRAFISVDMSTLESVEDCGSAAFSVSVTSANDLRAESLVLPSFTGARKIGSRFRGANAPNDAYYYGTIILPKVQKIGSYDFYQTRVSNAVFQLGSVGFPVTECDQRPFGGSTGSGTITVYTTGALLDTIKTAIQNSAGSNYTFIYKASEATTYGGNIYAAGDTMLTVGGA